MLPRENTYTGKHDGKAGIIKRCHVEAFTCILLDALLDGWMAPGSVKNEVVGNNCCKCVAGYSSIYRARVSEYIRSCYMSAIENSSWQPTHTLHCDCDAASAL